MEESKQEVVKDELCLDESKAVFTLLKMGVNIIYPTGYKLLPDIRNNKIVMASMGKNGNPINEGVSSLTPEGIIYVLQCKDQHRKQWIVSGGDS